MGDPEDIRTKSESLTYSALEISPISTQGYLNMPEMTSNWPHSAQILTSDENFFVFIFLDKMHSKMLNKYRNKFFPWLEIPDW